VAQQEVLPLVRRSALGPASSFRLVAVLYA